MKIETKINNILNEIGNEVAFVLGQNPNGSYLYCLAAENMSSVSLFLESENNATYYDATDKLFTMVQELWDVAESDKKWSILEYSISEGRLKASFTYADSLDADEGDHDRYVKALRKRFGNKPIIFPEDDDQDTVELTLDDFPLLDGNNEDEDVDPAQPQ